MDTLKKITIKTSTIKRYIKDINYYRKELAGLQAKHEEYSQDPTACPHVLKKQLEGIKETEAMIPDCEGRLEAAKGDLQEFLESHAGIDEVSASEVFKEAQSILA